MDHRSFIYVSFFSSLFISVVLDYPIIIKQRLITMEEGSQVIITSPGSWQTNLYERA